MEGNSCRKHFRNVTWRASWRLKLALTLIALSTAFGVLCDVSQGPPMPPGFTSSKPIQSPKGAEHTLSLGAKMVTSTAATVTTKAVPFPPGLVITNITVFGNSVLLRWQGSGNVQVQRSQDLVTWADVGNPTTAGIQSDSNQTPIGFYRLRVVQQAGTWAKSLGGVGNDSGQAVTVDPAGNIYLAGYFQGATDFGISAGGYDIFLAKYSSDGTQQWSKTFGSTGDELVSAIALDNSGNILLGGYFTGTGNFGGTNVASHGSQDAFLAKYSPTGDFLWHVTFGGIVSDSVTSIATDSQNNVIVTGWYQSDLNLVPVGNLQLPRSWGQADSFLIKFDPNGTTLFAKNFYNGSADYGRGVAVDASDNIILAGYFTGNINLGGGQFDSNWFTTPGGYVAKFDPSGAHIWSHRYGGSNTVTRFWTMATDLNGDVVVAGDFPQQTDLGGGTINGTSFGLDMFVAKYSGVNGAYVWAQPILGFQSSIGQPVSITADASGIGVTGNLRGSYDFSNGQTVSTTNGATDGFVARYSNDGTALSASGFGADSGSGNGIKGKVVTGYFSGSTGGLTSAGGTDVLLMSQ